MTPDARYSTICGYIERDLDTVFAPDLGGLDLEKGATVALRLQLGRRRDGRHPPALQRAGDLGLLIRDRHAQGPPSGECAGGWHRIHGRGYAPGKQLDKRHLQSILSVEARDSLTSQIVTDAGAGRGSKSLRIVRAQTPAYSVLSIKQLAGRRSKWPDLWSRELAELLRLGNPLRIDRLPPDDGLGLVPERRAPCPLQGENWGPRPWPGPPLDSLPLQRSSRPDGIP